MANVNDVIPLMREMKNTLLDESTELENVLTDLGIRPCNFKKVIKAISDQIKTAQNEFTIAFVGEFKTGKSTIINTLLQLTGESRLSSEYKADTAKCIRLLYKGDSERSEARVLFEGEPNMEDMTWREAKKYTSQVALDRDRALREKADRIREVHYYLETPLLAAMNILDLPGTGSSHMSSHTELTLQKLNEADIIFWVVSTLNEPGAEAVENLQYMNQKIIPVINVWQIETESVSGQLKPEELEEFIRESYGSYFNEEIKPIVYYAGEIEYAQSHGGEVQKEWGRESLLNCIRLLTQEEQATEKENRILMNLSENISAFRAFLTEQEEMLDQQGVVTRQQSERQRQLEKELSRIRQLAKMKIKEKAKETVEEILNNCADAADEFIEDQMGHTSLKYLIKSIGRKNKERLERELREKFDEEYLRLNETPNWYESLLNSFMEEAASAVRLEYSEFDFEMWEKSIAKGGAKLDAGFVKTMVGRINEVMKKQIGKDLLATIMGTVFFAFGGELLELIYLMLLDNAVANRGMDDKIEGVQKRARRSISRQKSVLTNELVKLGDEMNNEVYQSILNRLSNEQEQREEAYARANEALHDLTLSLDNYEEQFGTL